MGQVGAVIGPFVEKNFDEPAAEQDTDRGAYGQVVDLVHAQLQGVALSAEPGEQPQESQGIAQAVPPQIEAADVAEYRVDVVHEWSDHGNHLQVLFYPSDIKNIILGAAGQALLRSAVRYLYSCLCIK